MSSVDLPTVTQWISCQTVFITGASGFVGKVLLWKLLKSCTDINLIYVLLRRKKGKTSKQRLEELFASPMFDVLKKDDPKTFEKVKVVEGDVSEKFLGLDQIDWDMLQRDVTLFFSAAASVRFDDSLRKAIFTNTRSTRYAVLLAKGMTKLKAFIHVSTAFTNCYRSHIPEKVLPNRFDPEKLISAAEKFSEYDLEVFTPKIISEFPNTYIFTKNLGEQIVYEARHEIPLIIYRPAVVLTSVKEPEPGWCDSFNSIFIICGLEGKGILRTIIGHPETVISLINTDACVNGMIVSAWHRDVHLNKKKEPVEDKDIVVNATDYNYPLPELVDFCYSLEYTYPLSNVLWRCYCFTVSSLLVFQILTIILHVIPGLIIDGVLKFKGKQPRLMKIYRKMYLGIRNLAPFMCGTWQIDNHNYKRLEELTPPEEKKKFFMDSLFETTFDQMMFNCYIGVRKLFGDKPEFSQEDLDHSNRMYWVDFACRCILLVLFFTYMPFQAIFNWGVNTFQEYRTAWENIV